MQKNLSQLGTSILHLTRSHNVVIIAQELPDPDPVDVDVDVDATTSPTPPAKRSAESTQKQGTIKKKCLPLDECIEGKKVGKNM